MRGNDAWVSYLLELNALVFAVKSDDDNERLIAVHDALSIRHARRLAHGTADNENVFKISEGTAVYTELHLMFSRDEIMEIVRHWPEVSMYWENITLVAMAYGYFHGALYGML